jgi:hypothetical protein
LAGVHSAKSISATGLVLGQNADGDNRRLDLIDGENNPILGVNVTLSRRF